MDPTHEMNQTLSKHYKCIKEREPVLNRSLGCTTRFNFSQWEKFIPLNRVKLYYKATVIKIVW